MRDALKVAGVLVGGSLLFTALVLGMVVGLIYWLGPVWGAILSISIVGVMLFFVITLVEYNKF